MEEQSVTFQPQTKAYGQVFKYAYLNQPFRKFVA